MLRVIFVGAAVLALAACGSEKSGSVTDEDGNRTDYTIDQDGDEMTATFTTEEGTATMRSGKDVNVDLPAGFSIYPGAEVQQGTSFTANDGQGGLINMVSDDSPRQMIEFYRQQAEAAGAKITLDAKMGDRMMLAGEKEGDVGFTFSASPSGDQTEAQLMIGEGFQ